MESGKDIKDLTNVLLVGEDIVVVYGALMDAADTWQPDMRRKATAILRSMRAINPVLLALGKESD